MADLGDQEIFTVELNSLAGYTEAIKRNRLDDIVPLLSNVRLTRTTWMSSLFGGDSLVIEQGYTNLRPNYKSLSVYLELLKDKKKDFGFSIKLGLSSGDYALLKEIIKTI